MCSYILFYALVFEGQGGSNAEQQREIEVGNFVDSFAARGGGESRVAAAAKKDPIWVSPLHSPAQVGSLLKN